MIHERKRKLRSGSMKVIHAAQEQKTRSRRKNSITFCYQFTSIYKSLVLPTKSFDTKITMCATLLILSLLVNGCGCAMRVQQSIPIISTQTLMTAPTSNSNSLISTTQQAHASFQRCPAGVPPQWRPHLDAASKAHLAPGVALATLQHLSVVPIQVSGNSGAASVALSQQTSASQPNAYHPQNINNAGVTIEATFTVSAVIKRASSTMRLQPNQTVKLLYRVSAALSTMNLSLPLGSSGNQLYGSSKYNLKANEQQMKYSAKLQQHSIGNKRLTPTILKSDHQPQQQVSACAFDLSEHELAKEARKMFKVHKNYILFLDQTSQLSMANNQRLKQLIVAPTLVGGNGPATQKAIDAESALQHHQQLYPMATHAPLTNQTSRALSKILCRNCVAQVPQVQLVNATFVSVSALQQQRSIGSQGTYNSNNNGPSTIPNRIKLDCRVTGYPAPWVQWFRNGKLLRNSAGRGNGNNNSGSSGGSNNKAGRWFVQTSKWKGKHNVFLSRLELDLRSGRNETGIYECRAMSVVAREPAVGTYTLLVLPAQFALIPMQPLSSEATSVGSTDPQAGESSQQRLPAMKPASATTTAVPLVVHGQPSPSPSASSSSTSMQEQQQQRINGGTTSSKSTSRVAADSYYLPAAATTSPPSAMEGGGNEQSASSSSSSTSSDPQGPQINNNTIQQQQQHQELSKGQQCSSEMQDILCHNKGTCIKIVIGTTEELGCKCAEGYLGRRCEFKLTRHSDSVVDSSPPQNQDSATGSGSQSATGSSPNEAADAFTTTDKREAFAAN